MQRGHNFRQPSRLCCRFPQHGFVHACDDVSELSRRPHSMVELCGSVINTNDVAELVVTEHAIAFDQRFNNWPIPRYASCASKCAILSACWRSRPRESNHTAEIYLNLARRMTLTGIDQLWVCDNACWPIATFGRPETWATCLQQSSVESR